MEIIDQLERHRRGLYNGSFGYIGFNQDAEFNISIRTLQYVRDRLYYNGSGIVWDSDPKAEYMETTAKGSAIETTPKEFMLRIEKIHSGEQLTIDPKESAFSHGAGIFETLQLPKVIYSFGRHWSRLKASALHLFSCDLSTEDEAATLEAIKAYCCDSGQKDQVLKLSLIVLATGPVLYIYSRERTVQETSVKLYLNEAHPINENALHVGHKTHNYLENMWLLKKAKLRDIQLFESEHPG